MHPADDEFRETIDRLRRHSDSAHKTAVDIELIRAAKFREGNLPSVGASVRPYP
jgi:hypothetical protein